MNDTSNNFSLGPNRRTFLRGAASTAAVVAAGSSFIEVVPAEAAKPNKDSGSDGNQRQLDAYKSRTEGAKVERDFPLAVHSTNGDEDRYAAKIGNFSKGLPHNNLGEVVIAAWDSLTRALVSGEPREFELIAIAGAAKLVNPQAGLAFEMQGPDSHALSMRPAPAFSSAEEAGEIAENYWMALTRDIPFSSFPGNPLVEAAAKDLSALSDFRGPKSSGKVTPLTLFRGLTPGDVTGPYISQFFWQDTPFGSETIDRRMKTTASNVDYLTNYGDWLSTQNGAVVGSALFDPTPRYIRAGRDIAEWVHRDVLFQAYFNAMLILFRMGAPLDRGNPYNSSRTQIGFGTLGDPYIASVLCAVARTALKAVWFQKWFVHRRLRPEAFAGRVHNHVTGAAHYPIHPDILKSALLSELFRRNGTYLLPMAFPEGAPLHPAYGAGHATVAGACVTILKAFFDESWVLSTPVEASTDGLRLLPYGGPALTVGGELNKLAANVAIGRNIAGVYWRSDATESLRLGEEVALRYLAEEKHCFNEDFGGYSVTKFDGTTVTV